MVAQCNVVIKMTNVDIPPDGPQVLGSLAVMPMKSTYERACQSSHIHTWTHIWNRTSHFNTGQVNSEEQRLLNLLSPGLQLIHVPVSEHELVLEELGLGRGKPQSEVSGQLDYSEVSKGLSAGRAEQIYQCGA